MVLNLTENVISNDTSDNVRIATIWGKSARRFTENQNWIEPN